VETGAVSMQRRARGPSRIVFAGRPVEKGRAGSQVGRPSRPQDNPPATSRSGEVGAASRPSSRIAGRTGSSRGGPVEGGALFWTTISTAVETSREAPVFQAHDPAEIQVSGGRRQARR